MIKLDTKCSVSSHHGIPQSVIQEKILIAIVQPSLESGE